MTESQWLANSDAVPLFRFVAGSASERKLRLFACAAARRVLHMLGPECFRRAVEVSERFADGLANAAELREAEVTARHSADHMERGGISGWNAARTAAMTAWVSALAGAERAATHAADADLVREVFDNPFQPVTLDPSWLAWEGGAVVRLARAFYAERHAPELFVLGDALEDAGCTGAALLDHCRSGLRHVRGCWALDALLQRGGPGTG
jgi:hypothetical protein